MTRRCSHCSNNGHNSRTCPNRGVKIFGVRLTDGLIRKSVSMGNLTHYASVGGGGGGGGGGAALNGGGGVNGGGGSHELNNETPDQPSSVCADGYGSEDFIAGSSTRERKKGVPWTEEEHRMFLLGLQKLGKGDWRGISRNFVITRTPTQVASHAQKYFIRQCNVSRRKRRSSLFDIIADESVDTPVAPMDFINRTSEQMETQSDDLFPAPPLDEEGESMDSTNSNEIEAVVPNVDISQFPYPVVYPAYVAPFFPMAIPVWPEYNVEPAKEGTHEVLKPTAVHYKSPINVDELVGISRLSLGESNDGRPTPLSLKLVEGSSARQSAFHTNTASSSSGMNSAHKPIHAL